MSEETLGEEDGTSAGRDGKRIYVMEDPDAIKHMDALFGVLEVRCNPKVSATPSYSITEDATANAELLDALFAVINNKDEASDGDAVNTKSWRDRELPPSFFGAGSVNDGRERESSSAPETPEPRETSSSSPPPPVEAAAVRLASATPLVVVATRDCLTYYIE